MMWLSISVQESAEVKENLITQKNDADLSCNKWEPNFFDFEAVQDVPDFSIYRKDFKAFKEQDPLA